MVPKLKAALYSRTDEDLVIMGRTDALGVLGIEDAIARANLYRQTGCDMVFVEAPETASHQLQELGFAVAVWPVSSVFVVSRALEVLYRTIEETGSTTALHEQMVAFEEYMKIVGLTELRDTEARYEKI